MGSSFGVPPSARRDDPIGALVAEVYNGRFFPGKSRRRRRLGRSGAPASKPAFVTGTVDPYTSLAE
jgi:hypothetical protein